MTSDSPRPMIDATEMMTDYALMTAYKRSSGEPGDPEVEALLAEIQRRNLEI